MSQAPTKPTYPYVTDAHAVGAPIVQEPVNPLAFPSGKYENGVDVFPLEAGMSLRDYFAAKAMQGWLASYGVEARHPALSPESAEVEARNAYALADAMLVARSAPPVDPKAVK